MSNQLLYAIDLNVLSLLNRVKCQCIDFQAIFFFVLTN